MGISACMICLNDEAFIGLCIESIIDVVNDIVVVDGGSTDKTLEILDNFKTLDLGKEIRAFCRVCNKPMKVFIKKSI